MHGFPAAAGFLTRRPKRWWPWLAGGALAVVAFSGILALIILNATHHDLKLGPQHPEDVQVGGCTANAAGQLTAMVLMTNHSGGGSDYTVTVRFYSADGARTVGSGIAQAVNVAPGANRNVPILVPGHATQGPLRCTVTSAQRTAA